MVNKENIKNFIFSIYKNSFKKEICLLVLGGSLGRGNYVNGWSDADLLLVLEHCSGENLRTVKSCEENIKKYCGIEIDTMVTSKNNIECTPPKELHGKIKNFLFFLHKCDVLINRNLSLPLINYKRFGYGFWATYAEQEKNFLRRNIDINLKDNKSLQKTFKKNIKIIFLLLKQFFIDKEIAPCTYEEVLFISTKKFSPNICKKLKKYIAIRKMNAIANMTNTELKRQIDISINIFREISKIILFSK